MRSVVYQISYLRPILSRSFHSSRPAFLQSNSLVYSSFGNPSEVLRTEKIEIDENNLPSNKVLVKIERALVTPRDLAAIQGVIPQTSADFFKGGPRVGGTEAVGRIVGLGSDVQNLENGARVLVSADQGAWASHLLLDQKELKVVSSSMTSEEVLRGGVLGSISRVLKQAEIGANEVVLHATRSPSFAKLVDEAAALHQIKVVQAKDLKAGSHKVKLFLDGVGGENSLSLARHVVYGGTIAIYGGSWKPFRISATSLMLKKIKVTGVKFEQNLINAQFQEPKADGQVDTFLATQYKSAFEKLGQSSLVSLLF